MKRRSLRFMSTIFRVRLLAVGCGCLLSVNVVAAEPLGDPATASAAASAAPAKASGEPTYFQGTRVRLPLPAGFTPIEGAPGFENAETGARLSAVEIPAPFDKAVQSLKPESFAAQGMTLVQQKDIKVGERKGILMAFKGSGPQESLNFWMLYFGDEKSFFNVAAGFPSARSKELSQPLRKLLLSVEVDDALNVDPLAGARFTFEPADPWKFAFRAGEVACFTESGKLPPENATGYGVVMVGSGVGQNAISDPEDYARIVLRQLSQGATQFTVEANEKIEGGGYQLAAKGVNGRTSEPTRYNLVILFEPDARHYSFLYAFAPDSKAEAFGPQFTTMAGSFKLKPAVE